MDYNGPVTGLVWGFINVCNPFPNTCMKYNWAIYNYPALENPALGCISYDWGIGSDQMNNAQFHFGNYLETVIMVGHCGNDPTAGYFGLDVVDSPSIAWLKY